MMTIYSSRINADGIYAFTTLMMQRAPRRSCLAVRVLIDIVRNQGDSPANIMQRCSGDRDNTAVETMIKLLTELDICTLIDVDGIENKRDVARRRVYLTAYGAEFLGLCYK